MYALIDNDTVTHTWGNLPREAMRRQDTGEWVMNLEYADAAQRAACGLYEVVDAPQPVDPDGVAERTIGVIAGVPTVVWTVRPYTADEVAANAAAATRQQKAANVTAAPAVLRAGAGTPAERLAALEATLADLIESGVL